MKSLGKVIYETDALYKEMGNRLGAMIYTTETAKPFVTLVPFVVDSFLTTKYTNHTKRKRGGR